MFNENVKRKQHGIPSGFEALVTEKNGRIKNRKSHGNVHRDKLRGRYGSRKDIEYYHCGKFVHIRKECRKFKKEHKEKGEKPTIENEIATVATESDAVFIVYDDDYINPSCQDSIQVIDTVASFHFTTSREFFTS